MATVGATARQPSAAVLGPNSSRHSGSRKTGEAKSKVRRRTKSGCLTCRKRRIKCDEFRPICNNCIKSKRECEGYNPRVSFKDSRGSTEDLSSGFALSFSASNSNYLPANLFANPVASIPLTPIRPRLAPGSDNIGLTSLGTSSPSFQPGHGFAADVDPLAVYRNQPRTATNIKHGVSQTDVPAAHWNGGTALRHSEGVVQSHVPSPRSQTSSLDQLLHQTSSVEAQPSHWPTPSYSSEAIQPTYRSLLGYTSSESDHSSPSQWPQVDQGVQSVLHFPEGNPMVKKENVLTSGDPITTSSGFRNETHDHFNAYQNSQAYLKIGRSNTTQNLEAAAVEIQDDDYHDIFSDEEDEIPPEESLPSENANLEDSTSMVPLYVASGLAGSLSNFDNITNYGAIDTYRPERVANPLKNPSTARVFAHFIAFTGPTLSIPERTLSVNYDLTHYGSISTSYQTLWTRTLPMMALHNQSLLHAILAVSSLQIARLQGTAETPSLKHYAYSLKRVHHAVSHERRRHELTTLAATLILGFYEVMTAEHAKWSTHLHGATQLIKEIDYETITKHLAAFKKRQASQHHGAHRDSHHVHRNGSSTHGPLARPPENMIEVDERMVDVLMGRNSRKPYHINPVLELDRDLTEAEVHNYEALQDLNWWYRKQDIYHSLISGNALLMDYNRWSECPPRAALGDYSAIYGTFDHLMLIIGRLTDFIVTDRLRKIRVQEARGGVWKPAQVPLRTQAVPVAAQTPAHNNVDSANSASIHNDGSIPGAHVPANFGLPTAEGLNGIPFYGMAPSTETAHMPRAFQAKQPSPPLKTFPHSRIDEEDLELATGRAENEWNEIRAAFKIFADALGPEFQPVDAEECLSTPTPFGPSIMYRGYDIGAVWMHYYIGLIITMRSHPSMPPAAQMAVGVAARQTAELANEVGRIAASIIPAPPGTHIYPSPDAALASSIVPLFFAGVQYQDASQRQWTISRLRDIADRTGWASASLCANGCEAGWVKAARAGKGPPYEPVCGDVRSQDQRVSGKFSHLSGQPPTDPMDRRLIPFNQRVRLHWATGVIGTADDLSGMSLRNE